MRWTRPLLIVAILLIVWGVGATFYARLRQQNAASTTKPRALPDGITGTSQDWTYTERKGDKAIVFVKAKDIQENNNRFELSGVELHIFQKDGAEYDLVKSEKASFEVNKKLLFSEGAVEITMNVKPNEPPSGKLMQIKSSGVTFETGTGKASTDKPTVFQFDRGNGKAVGASYDPQTHELHMQSQIELNWHGVNKKAIPMKVEAGELTYKEKESRVFLGGWSKLTRDTMTLNAGPAVVTLKNGLIQEVNTEHATGSDARPNRKIDYAADLLTMNFDEDGQIKQIVGEKNARLISHAETAETTISSDRLDLDLDTASGDSVLKTARATGQSVAESKPIAKAGVAPGDTRVLRSDVILTSMRPNGQEIDNVETPGAGSIEFIPNGPDKPHRWMNGDHFWIKYGEKNQIQSLRSINVATRTLKPRAKDAKTDPQPALTWSKDLTAEFDPKTSQLSKLEQWTNFRYEEGTRKAKADRALLEQAKNLIHLTGGARVWDPTGSTDGDQILLDQKSGDFSAEGSVDSTRLPDQKKGNEATGGMLSEDEPLHAKAKKMFATDNNLKVRYEGNAIAWQGADRLEADVIEIDRDDNILKAHGHVVSQLLDKAAGDKPADGKAAEGKPAKKSAAPKPAKTKRAGAAPVFTIVQAPELLYEDQERIATYTGGVNLERPNMKIVSQELRAYLRDSSDSSSLDHAFADGQVQIVQTAPDRTRTGTSDHAEYYVDEAKVILEKGAPQLVDSLKGSTRGMKLTWFSNDDRLLVDGAEGQPAFSKLRRKPGGHQ